MKRSEFAFFAGIALFCAIYLAWALRMPFGGVRNPGPGFFPVTLGLAGVAISLGFIVHALAKGPLLRGAPMPKAVLARLAGYVVAVGLYAATQSIVGSYVGIFVLVFVLSRLSGLPGLAKPLALAAVCAAVAYVLFGVILGVPLPLGVLEG